MLTRLPKIVPDNNTYSEKLAAIAKHYGLPFNDLFMYNLSLRLLKNTTTIKAAIITYIITGNLNI